MPSWFAIRISTGSAGSPRESTSFLAGLCRGGFILHLSCDSTKKAVLFSHFLMWPVPRVTTRWKSWLICSVTWFGILASRPSRPALEGPTHQRKFTKLLTPRRCSIISMCCKTKWMAKINMYFLNTYWFWALSIIRAAPRKNMLLKFEVESTGGLTFWRN